MLGSFQLACAALLAATIEVLVEKDGLLGAGGGGRRGGGGGVKV
jgi:hypothetical protein